MSKHNNKQNKSSFQNSGQNDAHSVSFEEIQKKAYEIYQEKGGSDFDNWLEAEEALRQNKNSNAYASQAGE